jgi:hypothetical protein
MRVAFENPSHFPLGHWKGPILQQIASYKRLHDALRCIPGFPPNKTPGQKFAAFECLERSKLRTLITRDLLQKVASSLTVIDARSSKA